MCGIAGFTRLGKVRGRGIAQRINEFLVHRGPDQQGIFEGCAATLCAVRLKIIGLENGDQPLASADGKTVVVFNGEIYNHLEVRAVLEARGYKFHSSCDTETVLAAFLEWDTACFSRFRGMFAAALWNEPRRRLVLARDRLGIKPLYYYRQGDDLYFGSELKAILAHGDVPREIDFEALGSYLSLNYVPGPRTLIEGIRKVPPGHLIDWRDGKLRIERWWGIPAHIPRQTSFEDAKEELDSLLRQAVREHLMAEVPLGIWASGGLDSSTILHYAASESSSRLKTFSVSFPGRSFDESAYFREIARTYGTDHYELNLDPELDLPSAIEDLTYYSDEPSADAGALPVWYLSRLTRKHATVALSGDGADELFGGYETYLADSTSRPLRMMPTAARRLLQWTVERCLPVTDEKIGLEYKLKRWLEGSCLDPDEAHFFWNGTFSPAQRKRICPKVNGNRLGALVKALPSPHALLNRYLLVDQSYYLPDDILYKTDRMSMAHSLEVRPPFLDHRIVEFAASLPPGLKIRRWQGKFLLRELMRGKLPTSIIERKKTGFDIPTHDWFRGALRELLLDTLTPDAVEATGIFDARAIRSLIRDHMERRINVGYHLWGLLTLFLWMRRWKVVTLPFAESASQPQVSVEASSSLS
jgi:asparagine synthase (glutamine-hydrolysing)